MALKLLTLKTIYRRVIEKIDFLVDCISMRLLKYSGASSNPGLGLTLFWVPGGMSLMLHVEAAIALALRLRGNRVHAVICDGVYSACIKREITDNIPIEDWSTKCADCKSSCEKVLNLFGVPYSYIGNYVSTEELKHLKVAAAEQRWKNLDEFEYLGVRVGKNIKSAITRYLRGGENPNDDRLVEEYAYSGLISLVAAKNARDISNPARVFMSHGTYIDWGPALRFFIAEKLPLTLWMASYLPWRFYFRNLSNVNQIDIHNLTENAWKEISNKNLTSKENERLNKFLEARYLMDSSFDMKHFMNYTGDVQAIRSRMGLSQDLPIWGIFTHINWDSVSDYSPMLYESFNQWLIDTIEKISTITNVQWIIKIHPAESWDNPHTGSAKLIRSKFAQLPPHIRIMSSTDAVSPLDFFNLIDGVVTVYGTAGLEAAIHGKPIILAGDAHYGKKGFTVDSETREEYLIKLEKASKIKALSQEEIVLAKKYAHIYFISRQVPLPVVKDEKSKWWSFQINKRTLLLPNKSQPIDFICEKIIKNSEFIMDETLIEEIEGFN